jgi:hypothetical protein
MRHRRTGPDLVPITALASDSTTEPLGDTEPVGQRSHSGSRRWLAMLALAVIGALVVALAAVVHVQADLRSQRNVLTTRLAGEQRVADILSKSLGDLQKARSASYAGGGVLVLATPGTVRAAIAVVYTQYPGVAQRSVWLFLQAIDADPHVVYTLAAIDCNGGIAQALAEGSPVAGDLRFAVTNVNIDPDRGPYTVLLLGKNGPIGGVKLASDRTISVLPSGTHGC